MPSSAERSTRPGGRVWLPTREIIVRADGRCRFITITPAIQLAGIALIVLVACLGAAAMLALTQSWRDNEAAHAALAEREAALAGEQHQVATWRDELEAARLTLEKRQDFLERAVAMLPVGEEEGDEGDEAIAGETQGELERISAVLPDARGLAELERRQLAALAALTRNGEARAARAERAIRSLGLEPRRLLAASDGAAAGGMGGPLERLASEPDGSLDPRFERLATALVRMAALEQGLTRVPQVMPTQLARMTSRFGYRHDPFTGAAAMHAGLDFGGRHGEPILAAAAGTVSFVGTKGGYGNVVEITHGNGMMTRYAHLSRFTARIGRKVAAGDPIGALGSTGRSTGPHLHFEIRLNGQAIDPRPILEDAAHELAQIRAERGASRGADRGY